MAESINPGSSVNIPASKFSFAVESGTAVLPATAATLPVYAGVTPTAIKFNEKTKTTQTAGTGTIEYALQTKPATAAEATDNVTVKFNVPDTDHYTAAKTMVLDFSDVWFPEPGIYRYIITETASTNSGVALDSNRRILDVYVEDANLAAGDYLKITNYVLYVEDSTNAINDLAPSASAVTPGTVTYEDNSTATTEGSIVVDEHVKKSLGFVNKYPTASLTFGKEVTGNQGSKDKYFKFDLSITNVPEGTVFGVILANAQDHIEKNPNAATTCITADGGVDNPTTITAVKVGENPVKAEGTFYLQDGQYITITGFAEGMAYELKENKEDYEQTKGIAQSLSTFEHDSTNNGYDVLDDGTYNATTGVISGTFAIPTGGTEVASVYTGFTNSKTGVIPTGVVLSAVPWVIAGVVILAGIVFFAIRSKRKYEEE